MRCGGRRKRQETLAKAPDSDAPGLNAWNVGARGVRHEYRDNNSAQATGLRRIG